MSSATNKRIAKNTLLLYFRMAVTVGISLLTSRVVLDKLGIQDFGIYDVVYGIIAALSFLFSSMSLMTQRFLTYELGKNDSSNLPRIFSMSINVQFCIALVVIVLAETIGLWFLNFHLNIPDSRLSAANWIYQFAIFSTILSILLVPYNAIIIAQEMMGFYAWISIANVCLRLLIVYLLAIGDFDKLILYGFLGTIVSILIQVAYVVYCRVQFKETVRYHYEKNPDLFKEMFSFSGWCLLGGASSITKAQGITFILNIFFNVSVNAAMGIANRVADAINQFVANFQTAANPQIIKQYAAGETASLSKLINRVSKFSYCLILLLVLPIFLNTEFILHLWLVKIPAYTANFIQLLLIFILLDSLAGPQWMSILASGKIRNYYIIETAITLCIIPLSIILLKMGYGAAIVLTCKIVVNIVVLIWRAFYMAKNVGISTVSYFKNAILPLFIITPIAVIPPLMVKYTLSYGWLDFSVSSATAIISVATTTWFIGLNRGEKDSVKNIILQKIKG